MTQNPTTWHEVGTRNGFGDEDVFGVQLNGIPIAIYTIEGQIFATDDMCTHGMARLSEGWLENGLIECPLHQGMFDVKTGKVAGAPCVKDIKTYPTKLEGELIFVGLVETAEPESDTHE